MGQQRCGYNGWLKADCHTRDGRTAYGPESAGTRVDACGGWHDAGDLLKYLLTSSNATAQLLLAAQLRREAASGLPLNGRLRGLRRSAQCARRTGAERRSGLARRSPLGTGLDAQAPPGPRSTVPPGCRRPRSCGLATSAERHRRLRLGPGQRSSGLFCGWPTARAQRLPKRIQRSRQSGRPVRGRYGTGAPDLEGRPAELSFAERCLQAGVEVYQLGQAREGVQQGNSYGAPYRYEETTWADDMEWGATELYRATGKAKYLDDARRYASLAADESWMGKATARHYQYYPFFNAAHFRLHDCVDGPTQKNLAGYYRAGIERCLKAGRDNPYRVGVPFIWCSNNLVVALVTQCLCLERMTGEARYRDFAVRQRDWLLGRNPWGFTMFTDIGSRYPKDVHLITTQLSHKSVRGGLVDGPVAARIFQSLRGVSIREPDPLAAFQDPRAVYHNDVHDYSTNEPTMDGTAAAILMWARVLLRNRNKRKTLFCRFSPFAILPYPPLFAGVYLSWT